MTPLDVQKFILCPWPLKFLTSENKASPSTSAYVGNLKFTRRRFSEVHREERFKTPFDAIEIAISELSYKQEGSSEGSSETS